MSQAPIYLRNFQSVVEAFGYWPGFHDSRVLRFRADTDVIELEVEAWEMSDEVDTQGYFKLNKKHEIGFVFRDIVASELDDFISENILFELGFSSEEDRLLKGYFSVELDSAMGSDLCGRFQAKSGEVIFVRPSQSKRSAANKNRCNRR